MHAICTKGYVYYMCMCSNTWNFIRLQVALLLDIIYLLLCLDLDKGVGRGLIHFTAPGLACSHTSFPAACKQCRGQLSKISRSCSLWNHFPIIVTINFIMKLLTYLESSGKKRRKTTCFLNFWSFPLEIVERKISKSIILREDNIYEMTFFLNICKGLWYLNRDCVDRCVSSFSSIIFFQVTQ